MHEESAIAAARLWGGCRRARKPPRVRGSGDATRNGYAAPSLARSSARQPVPGRRRKPGRCSCRASIGRLLTPPSASTTARTRTRKTMPSWPATRRTCRVSGISRPRPVASIPKRATSSTRGRRSIRKEAKRSFIWASRELSAARHLRPSSSTTTRGNGTTDARTFRAGVRATCSSHTRRGARTSM